MSRNTDDRIPVTEAMREELESWQSETGFGTTALFRHAEINGLFQPSKTLSAPAFQAILKGRTKTIRRSDLDAVLSAYRSIPEDHYGKPHALSRQKARVPFTDEMRAQLQKVLDKCTLSRAALLRLHGAPQSLTAIKLGRIMRRDNTTIQKDHAEFLERLIAERSSK